MTTMDIETGVLAECLEFLASGLFQYTQKHTRDRLIYHPDIKYFQRIQNANHWQYHKHSGRSIDRIKTTTTALFDPYSVADLLARIKTYLALSWHLPSEVTAINELICAQNGWKCVEFSRNNPVKNHLMCTCCQSQLILKWDDQPAFASRFWGQDEEGVGEPLNLLLETKYYEKIVTSGHQFSCSWRHFETPLVGFYYPRPYINDHQLITEYLANLENLANNLAVLVEHELSFSPAFVLDTPLNDKFIANSNHWLATKYKTNTNLIPQWVYRLAVYGWSLHVQSFSTQLVLLLICDKCNQRIFVNSATHPPVPSLGSVKGLKLLESQVLPPNDIPMTALDSDDEGDQVSPATEHKLWCCRINDMASSTNSIPLYEWLISVVSDSPFDLFDRKRSASETSQRKMPRNS